MDGWRPGIGDPTFLGWFTVFGYFVGTFVCWKNFRAQLDRLKLLGSHGLKSTASDRDGGLAEGLGWLAISALMGLLGINKQLDLQTGLAELGRELALSQGWYAERRLVQALFIASLAIVGLLVGVRLVRWARRGSSALRFAVGGACTLLFFIVIRAASFHHLDVVLGSVLAGTYLHRILELVGVAIVVVAAWKAPRRIRPKAKPAPNRAIG